MYRAVIIIEMGCEGRLQPGEGGLGNLSSRMWPVRISAIGGSLLPSALPDDWFSIIGDEGTGLVRLQLVHGTEHPP